MERKPGWRSNGQAKGWEEVGGRGWTRKKEREVGAKKWKGEIWQAFATAFAWHHYLNDVVFILYVHSVAEPSWKGNHFLPSSTDEGFMGFAGKVCEVGFKTRISSISSTTLTDHPSTLICRSVLFLLFVSDSPSTSLLNPYFYSLPLPVPSPALPPLDRCVHHAPFQSHFFRLSFSIYLLSHYKTEYLSLLPLLSFPPPPFRL